MAPNVLLQSVRTPSRWILCLWVLASFLWLRTDVPAGPDGHLRGDCYFAAASECADAGATDFTLSFAGLGKPPEFNESTAGVVPALRIWDDILKAEEPAWYLLRMEHAASLVAVEGEQTARRFIRGPPASGANTNC
jgi:hypothetical protein